MEGEGDEKCVPKPHAAGMPTQITKRQDVWEEGKEKDKRKKKKKKEKGIVHLLDCEFYSADIHTLQSIAWTGLEPRLVPQKLLK